MKMNNLAACTVFCLGLSATVASADTLQMVMDSADACASAAPKLTTLPQTLKDAGWQFFANDGDIRIYMTSRKDAVFAMSPTYEQDDPSCIFGVKAMSVEQSASLGQKLAGRILGKSATPVPAAELSADMATAWIGEHKGRTSTVIVYRFQYFANIYRGSLIQIGL